MGSDGYITDWWTVMAAETGSISCNVLLKINNRPSTTVGRKPGAIYLVAWGYYILCESFSLKFFFLVLFFPLSSDCSFLRASCFIFCLSSFCCLSVSSCLYHTLWSRFNFEKLIVAQTIKQFPSFMGADFSTPQVSSFGQNHFSASNAVERDGVLSGVIVPRIGK